MGQSENICKQIGFRIVDGLLQIGYNMLKDTGTDKWRRFFGIWRRMGKEMKDLQDDIKNREFRNVYLLFGEEEYLKKQYRDRLWQTLNPDNDTMNAAVYVGRDTDPAKVIDLAETMPFFAERRIIFLEDTGFFKNKCEGLPEYLSELPEYLCMVFMEKEVDKRSRMYKAVNKNGRTVEFKRQTEQTLARWVLGILNRENKKITKQDMELFLSRTGTDMSRIATELEKLICYCAGDEIISREAILEITSELLENKIFEMIRAVTERDQRKALDMYYDLLALKEPPMRILFLIARQYNILLQIKELAAQGMGQNEIAARAGVQSFVVRNGLPVARRYSLSGLRGAVEELVRTETEVKSGRIPDALSVELLIVKYSGGAARADAPS